MTAVTGLATGAALLALLPDETLFSHQPPPESVAAPTGERPEKLDPAVREFALERCRAAVRLTAGLWLSAWQASAKVKLPEWHQQPPEKL